MEKILITGAGGFMGQHLVNFFVNKGDVVIATYYNPTVGVEKLNPRAKLIECDLRDRSKIKSILAEFKPNKIFHLAAQSYPKISWKDPWTTIESNVIGTINLFEAVKELNLDCKILNAGTSGEYGLVEPEEVPVKEDHKLNPLHPYGVSKLAQEKLAYQYFKNFGIKSITVRIFNTTGPKKVGDVCADFTKRLVEIEKGINSEKKLIVGNLNTKRAITDVRDLIKAFDLALDKAKVGEVYNLSGKEVYGIKEIIKILKNLVDFEFDIKQDPSLMRPTDEPIIYGDSSKFKNETGWSQDIPLEKTLRDMLDYWREVI